MNRAERRAYLLGIRAERLEEPVAMCEDHGEDIDFCTRRCVESRYEVQRAPERLEGCIEELPDNLHAIAEGARAAAREHGKRVRTKRWMEELRADRARAYALALRKLPKDGTPPSRDRYVRDFARQIVAENNARIAALVEKAQQWLHDLVLQSRVPLLTEVRS